MENGDNDLSAENIPAEQSGEALPTANVYKKDGEAVAVARKIPEWKVSGCFSSNMVIQQNEPVNVFGFCSHTGASVTGEWDGEKVTGRVDENGKFNLVFSKRPASKKPTVMTVRSDYGSSVFTDVLVGDVWLLGGQSNAELHTPTSFERTPDVVKDISEEDNIRLFCQTQAFAASAKEYFDLPAGDIINGEWQWQKPGKEAAYGFSAMGYFFGKLLTQRIDIPIGLVMICAGGACLRELMPADTAESCGYREGANVPTGGYFNTLISPWIGVRFKGQLFFQGESEGIWKEMALSYDKDLAALVDDEKKRFGIDFPFYNVQLSSYRHEGGECFPFLQWVRLRQASAGKYINNYHLIVDRDLGVSEDYVDWAHSPLKYELGKRLANIVLSYEYGFRNHEKVESPKVLSAERKGDRVSVKFDKNIFALDTKRDYFAGNDDSDYLANKDGKGFFESKYVKYMKEDGGIKEVTGFYAKEPGKEDVKITLSAVLTDRNTVLVTVPENVDCEALVYAYDSDAYIKQANLCGENGLPAASLLIDFE